MTLQVRTPATPVEDDDGSTTRRELLQASGSGPSRRTARTTPARRQRTLAPAGTPSAVSAARSDSNTATTSAAAGWRRPFSLRWTCSAKGRCHRYSVPFVRGGQLWTVRSTQARVYQTLDQTVQPDRIRTVTNDQPATPRGRGNAQADRSCRRGTRRTEDGVAGTSFDDVRTRAHVSKRPALPLLRRPRRPHAGSRTCRQRRCRRRPSPAVRKQLGLAADDIVAGGTCDCPHEVVAVGEVVVELGSWIRVLGCGHHRMMCPRPRLPRDEFRGGTNDPLSRFRVLLGSLVDRSSRCGFYLAGLFGPGSGRLELEWTERSITGHRERKEDSSNDNEKSPDRSNEVKTAAASRLPRH